MKKLFFIALFSFGLFAISNAQVLTYTLNNVSALDWKFGMDDAGPTGTIIYGLPAGSPAITGAIFPSFAFQLDMKTKNSAGCSGGTTAFGPGFGTIPIGPCVVASSVVYNITTVVPFVQYNMDLFFL